MSRGKIIVFEGLDYSFKETNTKRLYEFIKENITDKVILISFPNYASDSSENVKRYLNNKYGKCSEINPYEASMYFAIDRAITVREKKIKELYEEGYIIIFDRYVGSNIIFQTPKIKNVNERATYIKWALDFEFNKLELPKPDITIYLNMPLSISYELLQERKHKCSTDVDGHEDNYEFMKQTENSALTLASFCKWNVIDCVKGNTIKSKDELFTDILKILNYNQYNLIL